MTASDNIRHATGKIGLALGSGAARGWAHIGVVRALIEAGIRVDCIAGTSIGALVGAVYASGHIENLEDVVHQLDWRQIAYFFDVVLPKSGLIEGRKLASFISDHVEGINIENLPIPFCAVSTDLMTGEEIIIRDGDIIEAVRASISIPGIFTPVRMGGRTLVDGALVNPVPVSAARSMGADFVIAVDVNSGCVDDKMSSCKSVKESETSPPDVKTVRSGRKKHKIFKFINDGIALGKFPGVAHDKHWMGSEPLPNIFEVLVYSFNIMEQSITETRLKTEPPDLLIQPGLNHIKFLEFTKADEAIAEGYNEAMKQLDSNRL